MEFQYGWRWIMYLYNPLGGFELVRVHNFTEAREELRSYGENTGFYQDLQTNGEYGCSASLYPYSPEDWMEAERLRHEGCPFDYPSHLVRNGPRGGVSVIPA